MAICPTCGKEMTNTEDTSCCKYLLFVDRYNNSKMELYERIPAGDPDDLLHYDMEDDQRCHDCNVGKGEYHHFNCDAERCPRCNMQLLSCDCSYKYNIFPINVQPRLFTRTDEED